MGIFKEVISSKNKQLIIMNYQKKKRQAELGVCLLFCVGKEKEAKANKN